MGPGAGWAGFAWLLIRNVEKKKSLGLLVVKVQ